MLWQLAYFLTQTRGDFFSKHVRFSLLSPFRCSSTVLPNISAVSVVFLASIEHKVILTQTAGQQPKVMTSLGMCTKVGKSSQRLLAAPLHKYTVSIIQRLFTTEIYRNVFITDSFPHIAIQYIGTKYLQLNTQYYMIDVHFRHSWLSSPMSLPHSVVSFS